jgi:DNA-binding Xre family transcriptional regulator
VGTAAVEQGHPPGAVRSNIASVAQRLAKQLAAFLRTKRGNLTYQQFSRIMKISPAILHRLEMPEQNVTLKTLDQLVSRLKCSLSDVFPEKRSNWFGRATMKKPRPCRV